MGKQTLCNAYSYQASPFLSLLPSSQIMLVQSPEKEDLYCEWCIACGDGASVKFGQCASRYCYN